MLGVGVKAFLRCIIKRQSFKAIYPAILKKVEPYLISQYSPVLRTKKGEYGCLNLVHKKSSIIWFCWLQGLDEAPEIVRVCYVSLKRHLPEREIKVIDNTNWKEYVDLPEYVTIKWEKGRIPAANFSDLLRLELLIKYGGTWVDSTVLCTGFSSQTTQESIKYLDADLFMFQYTPQGTVSGISISNWFISACSNNEVLLVLRDMLYAYWKDFDCTIDYYIFHLFFRLVAREFPEQIAAMPYGRSQRSIALMKHSNDTFNQEKWDRLVGSVAFHKLSYRISEEVKNNKGNYYNYMLKRC